MKKVIFTVLVAVLLFSATNVSAMSKDQFLAKVEKTYTINGNEFSLDESQKLQVERYLAENEVSEDDLDTIASKFEDAMEIVKNGKATSLKTLSESQKNKMLELIKEISKETDIKITVSDGVITVYNLDGTVFTEISEEVIKYTDTFNYLAMVGGIVSVIGIIAIALKIRKANA